jgi:NodT family efflux transporter outer membrane factor (OMF) lipoprotein
MNVADSATFPFRRCAAAIAVSFCASILTGCMVGPDYRRPKADVPETWLDMKAPTKEQTDHDLKWWTTFNDPALNSLVDRAFAQNLTLREAGLRVIQARALRGIAVGEFFPQNQAATGQVSDTGLSKNAPLGRGNRWYSEYSVGLEAAWELDFWGRFRRGIESADASLNASVADYDSVLIMLAADVSTEYVIIRSLQEQLVFTRINVKSQQDTLELTKVRNRAGAVSELDVATAQATLSNTQAFIPALEDALRQNTMALCVLLGRTPSNLEAELGGSGTVPAAPAEIALGIPAELLRRRPDVRRAERTAAALSAQIGVATADLYPSVTIKGMTGFHTSTFKTPGVHPNASNLLDADSFEGFVGLDVNWPILNYGRIENSIRVADARFQEAAAVYQNTVLQAAADVETGLSSFLRNRERAGFLSESVIAAQRTVDLALIQYRQGAVDFLRVNQAQVDLVDRQNSLVIARASVAQGAIATYRALGGGWETYANKEFVPQQTIDEMRSRTDWGDILSPNYDRGADLLFKRPRRDAPADSGVRRQGDPPADFPPPSTPETHNDKSK